MWGLDRTSSGELTTVVETTPPTAALGENGIRHASCLLRKYVVSGCRVIAKAGAESHIVLDLCHEEWTYQALLHVGTDATHTRSRGYSGKKQDILCRIVSHTILPFQGKEREVIQVAYSYVTQKNERRVLGRAFFVEGLGQLLGDVSEPLLCRQATELELKKIRRFVDKNEYHQGADFGAEMF